MHNHHSSVADTMAPEWQNLFGIVRLKDDFESSVSFQCFDFLIVVSPVSHLIFIRKLVNNNTGKKSSDFPRKFHPNIINSWYKMNSYTLWLATVVWKRFMCSMYKLLIAKLSPSSNFSWAVLVLFSTYPSDRRPTGIVLSGQNLTVLSKANLLGLMFKP